MTWPTDPADRHRVVAARFEDVVGGVRDWEAPTPVASWRARDIVEHLVTWLPGFVAGGSEHHLSAHGAGDTTDPPQVWRTHATRVQALLDDPVAASSAFAHPQLPPQTLAEAVAAYYVTDVFLHTWDLARATAQDDALDAEVCAELLAGMEPMADTLAASGQYGPRVPVPDDATTQERLIGLIGRDPAWRP